MNDWKKEHEHEDRRKKGNGMVKTTATEPKVSVFFGVTFEEFLKLTDKDQVQAIELISRRFGVGNKALAKDFGVSREEFAKKVWDRLKLGRLSGGRQTKAQSAALQRLSDAGVGGIKIEVGKKPVPWTENGEKVCVAPLDCDVVQNLQDTSNPQPKDEIYTWTDLGYKNDDCFNTYFAKIFKKYILPVPEVATPQEVANLFKVKETVIDDTVRSCLVSKGLIPPTDNKQPSLDPNEHLMRRAEFEAFAMAVENRNQEQFAALRAKMPVDTWVFCNMTEAERKSFILSAPTHAYSWALGLYMNKGKDSDISCWDSFETITAQQVFQVCDSKVCQPFAGAGHRKVRVASATKETKGFLEEIKAAVNNMSAEKLAEAKKLAEVKFGAKQMPVSEAIDSGPELVGSLEQVSNVPEPPAPEPDSSEPAQHDGCTVASSFCFTDEQKQAFVGKMFAMFTDEQKQAFVGKMFAMFTDEQKQQLVEQTFVTLSQEQKNKLLVEWLVRHSKEKEELAFAQLSECLCKAF